MWGLTVLPENTDCSWGRTPDHLIKSQTPNHWATMHQCHHDPMNSPFYSSVLCDQAFEQKWGLSWLEFDAVLPFFPHTNSSIYGTTTSVLRVPLWSACRACESRVSGIGDQVISEASLESSDYHNEYNKRLLFGCWGPISNCQTSFFAWLMWKLNVLHK